MDKQNTRRSPLSSVQQLQRLWSRIHRISKAVATNAGPGDRWSCTFENGSTTQYVFRGIKSLREFEDEVSSQLVWVWSLKDHIQAWAADRGINPELVEQAADSTWALRLCADLANREKHPRPRKSRSGVWPRLGKVAFSAPQESISRLIFGPDSVEVEFKNQEEVKFIAPVLDNQGNEVGDALEIVSQAIKCWEDLILRLGADRSPDGGF